LAELHNSVIHMVGTWLIADAIMNPENSAVPWPELKGPKHAGFYMEW